MVFLPEACDFIAESKEESVQLAESLYGPLVAKYRKLAASLKVWVSLGGLHVKVRPRHNHKVYIQRSLAKGEEKYDGNENVGSDV